MSCCLLCLNCMWCGELADERLWLQGARLTGEEVNNDTTISPIAETTLLLSLFYQVLHIPAIYFPNICAKHAVSEAVTVIIHGCGKPNSKSHALNNPWRFLGGSSRPVDQTGLQICCHSLCKTKNTQSLEKFKHIFVSFKVSIYFLLYCYCADRIV